jgi:TRAP transporter TAXI family solute receptor
MLRRVSLFAIGLILYAIAPVVAQTQTTPQRTIPQPPANPYLTASSWTLGMMTGSISGASLEMASDLAGVLNEYPELRIVPMLGTGSIQNINDLLYLKGVDVAIVQQDVLSHLKRTKRMPGIEDRIHYIARLHSEEFHVLARMKYMCLGDLTGRKVNFGPEGSGSAMTAQTVFEAHNVKVQPQYMDQATAIEKLRTGEIDATVFVSGKPSRAFAKIRYMDSVHFLDVEFVDDLQKSNYLPAIMTHDDYPDLIAPNETVSTVAVSAVMVASQSRPKNEQAKLSRFVASFFSKFDQLREKPHHGKWQEVNLRAPVAGWTRFAAAEKWLAEHPQAEAQSPSSLIAGLETRLRASFPAGREPPSTEQIRGMFLKFLQARKPGEGDNREELFNQFVHWYQQDNPN